jgi:uncharacterized protein YoxC
MAKTLTVYLAADLKKFNSGMDDAARKAQGLGSTMSGMLGPALVGAAAAAGAFATKLAVDGVQAAVDDEAASAKLAQTLQNLGFAHDTQPVEDYISTLERSLGIADDELRPAYDRLVRSIGNTEEANRALALSLDVAQGTTRSLDSVVQALGRAYDGNTAGLSRLGAGLDKAVLASGDMNAITAQLAATFGGQATTQAATFQGQVQRLQQAVDNLAEAFGAGLLDSLGETNEGTGDLVDTMENFEPILRLLGQRLGETAAGLGKVAGPVADAADGMQEASESTNFFASSIDYLVNDFPFLWNGLRTVSNLVGDVADGSEDASLSTAAMSGSLYRSAVAAERAVPGFEAIAGAVDDIGAESEESAFKVASLAEALAAVGGNTFNWRREVNGATNDARDFAIELNYNAYQARRAAAAAAEAAAGNRSYGGSASTAAAETDRLTAAEKRLQAAYERQQGLISETQSKLSNYQGQLESLTSAAEEYADVIRGGLESALDLGKAYEAQFNKEGEATGISLYEGFQRQVDHLEWYGNVLGALKQEGASPAFIAAIAEEGAGIGGALGQQLLGDSMVKELSDQWTNVQAKITTLTGGLIPEFLQTGIASGKDLVTGLTQQLQNEVGTLGKIGKQIAKPVGAEFKAQIAADIAEALKQIEAASSAARAEKVAQAERQSAALTEQAVAQALGNIIGRSDARTGRFSMGVPLQVLQ